MRVLFLQDNGLNESPAVSELSALLKSKGHATSLLLEDETPDLEKSVYDEDPDLVIVPSSIQNEPWVDQTVRRLKAKFPDLRVVLGGSLPTLSRDVLERVPADYAVTGEAERPVAALLAGDAPSSIPGLSFRDKGGLRLNAAVPGVEDLDSLPLPDRALYFDRYPFMAAFPWKKMVGGRGCVYDCSFCYLPSLATLTGDKAVRRKSPERLKQEVLALRKWPVKHIHFSDDLFVSDFKWISGFAETWKETQLPYSINTTADFITKETARLLADSGCRSVSFGIETADESVRLNSLKKSVRDGAILRAARLVREHGMYLTTFNMLASPDDSFAAALATLKLNAELGVDYARVNLATPLQGTGMMRLKGADRAPEDYRRFRNLYALFNLGVSMPALIPLIEALADFPFPSLLAPAALIRLWQEKKQFGLSLADGLAYFRHVGLPHKRTANYVSLLA